MLRQKLEQRAGSRGLDASVRARGGFFGRLPAIEQRLRARRGRGARLEVREELDVLGVALDGALHRVAFFFHLVHLPRRTRHALVRRVLHGRLAGRARRLARARLGLGGRGRNSRLARLCRRLAGLVRVRRRVRRFGDVPAVVVRVASRSRRVHRERAAVERVRERAHGLRVHQVHVRHGGHEQLGLGLPLDVVEPPHLVLPREPGGRDGIQERRPRQAGRKVSHHHLRARPRLGTRARVRLTRWPHRGGSRRPRRTRRSPRAKQCRVNHSTENHARVRAPRMRALKKNLDELRAIVHRPRNEGLGAPDGKGG